MNNLRKIIRGILKESFFKESMVSDYVEEYQIRFNKLKDTFILYNVFYDDNDVIKKMEIVSVLGKDPLEAEAKAYKITKEKLKAKLPSAESKKSYGDIVSPDGKYKGQKIKDMPLDYLINFMRATFYVSKIKKDNIFLSGIYNYLTKERAEDTKNHIEKMIGGLTTTVLMLNFQEYKNDMYHKEFSNERLLLGSLIYPAIVNELRHRGFSVDSEGQLVSDKTGFSYIEGRSYKRKLNFLSSKQTNSLPDGTERYMWNFTDDNNNLLYSFSDKPFITSKRTYDVAFSVNSIHNSTEPIFAGQKSIKIKIFSIQ
jgi:hypothetical protein